MATGIVQCDRCEKVVKQEEAHGWLDVRVYVTKPDEDTLNRMKQDPTVAKLLDAQGITSAELPALIGGDFCCVGHLVEFYQAQATLQDLPTTEDQPPDPNQEEFDRYYQAREAAKRGERHDFDPEVTDSDRCRHCRMSVLHPDFTDHHNTGGLVGASA